MPTRSAVEAQVAERPALELLALSRIVAAIQGRNVRATHQVCRALAMYGATGTVQAGLVLAPPVPDLPAGP